MSKRILVTSTDLMMVQFLVPHVINLCENGYVVEIACSDVGGRMGEIQEKLKMHVECIHTVCLVRSPVNLTNIKGYYDMKDIIEQGNYDIIWTNEPVMGVATRLAARGVRKQGTKVLYMVHGFHFYKGAPLINWLIYYPIEVVMSRCTDIITTINNEDYIRAKKMYAHDVKRIHGIGVDTGRLQKCDEQSDVRKELGISSLDIIVLSVGELNENKNQKVLIRALGKLKDGDIHYVICGKGNTLNKLQLLAKKEGVDANVHFLGYRNDVVDICSQADIFAFPTYREGLGLAALEAMYCGLPLITSNSRGPSDFMEDGKTGFICAADSADEFAMAIAKLKNDVELSKQCGNYNKKKVKRYCLDSVKNEIISVIKQVGE